MVDFIDELLDDKGDEGDGTGDLPSRADISGLRKEIEALNKEKHGLLKNVKTERSRRQEISGRLNQLTDTVNGILATKEEAGGNPEVDPETGKLAVKWTEDGEGFIKADQIEEYLTPYQERITELEQMVQNSTAKNSAEMNAEKVRQSIVGEDERYSGAYRKYQAARKWVVDQVTDFARVNDVGRPLTSGEALDYVFADKDLEAEFTSAYPNLNLDDIVTAEDSQRHLRRTLSNMADAMTPSEGTKTNAKPDSRFQKVLEKPSSLGNQANAKAGHESVLDKLESLKSTDLMELSDAQIDALLNAVANEEKQEGVNF